MIAIYYPLLKNANNEMKALRKLKESSKEKVIPIIESKRIKKENLTNWESTFRTLGSFLKERIDNISFIYDYNCAFEDLGDTKELITLSGDNLVQHCTKKLKESELNFIPCFHHDSPEWLINSIVSLDFQEIAVRVRCHTFQESFNQFVIPKIINDLRDYKGNVTLILDFYNKSTTLDRIQKTIEDFQEISFSKVVYLATSCPENANDALPHQVTHVGTREEYSNYIQLKNTFPTLEFGDYTTRLKGEILKGFNHYNSYIKIFYSTEDSYYIAKSNLIGDDGETTFHEVCRELIDQDFYPGPDFSFGDSEIYNCALGNLTIAEHQSPIAIGVNHHIETTIDQLESLRQSSLDFSVS